MHVRRKRAFSLGTLALLALAWSGCEGKKQTELVAGVSTQVRVPRDLKAIRIDVLVGGVVQFCRAYRVYDGKVQLPRSLGALPITDSRTGEPITITVSGFTEEFSDSSSNPTLSDCVSVAPKVGKDTGVRILRRSRQPYVQDSVLYLPMPLKYSCYDKACDDETKTCKAGRCVDATIDSTKLPKFSQDLVDGTGGACFHASQCFAAAAPAIQVDPDACTFAIPNTPSAPPQLDGVPPNPFPNSGDGVNVMVVYDGGYSSEILDKSADEGFTIPDPAKPQMFQLAPGLCDMLKGTDDQGNATPHRITGVFASGTCRAKDPFQPLCASDQNAQMGVDESGISGDVNAADACQPRELKPPKAVLMVVADDSTASASFYEQAGPTTVSLSLSDPAFARTDVGLTFFPGPAACATAGAFTPAVPPKPAHEAKTEIAGAFGALAANGNAGLKNAANVDLDGALRDTYALLSSPTYATYYRRAVLVLGNRELNTATCPGPDPKPPAEAAAAAAGASAIRTYAITLTSPAGSGPSDPIDGAAELATAAAYTDARTSKAAAKDAFQRIVNELATCVYDVATPAERPAAGDVLSYSDPIADTTATITYDAACNSETAAASGWGVDPSDSKRVYVCGAACDAYRSVLQTASLYAAQNGKPSLAVPIFAHKQGCAPKASAPPAASDGGAPAPDAGAADAGADSGAADAGP